MDNRFYEIPKEHKVDFKIFRSFYFKDIVIIISASVFLMVVANSGIIYPGYKLAFFIVSALKVLFFLSPSLGNPGKRQYHTVLYGLKRDNTVYSALDHNKEWGHEQIGQKAKEVS